MTNTQDHYEKYLPYTVYAVGKQFPFANPKPGTEHPILITNDMFITLAFFSQDAEEDAVIFQSEPVIVGLWAEHYLPFIVLAFPQNNLALDFFFNALKVTPEGWKGWTEGSSQFINLMLVDEVSGILKVLRQVPIPEPMARRIRRIATQQRQALMPEMDELLDRQAEILQRTFPTWEMLSAIKQLGPDWYGTAGTLKTTPDNGI